MATNLNLLPQDLSLRGGVMKVAKLLSNVAIVGFAGFIMFAVFLVAFFVISSNKLKKLNSSLESLKTQVKAREATEQRVVLIKDRLAKIKALGTNKSTAKDLENLEVIFATLPPQYLPGGVDVQPAKLEMSLNFPSSSAFGDSIEKLVGLGLYKSIVMSSLSFNPTIGYSTSLKFSEEK